MTLTIQDLGALGELIGSVAVLATPARPSPCRAASGRTVVVNDTIMRRMLAGLPVYLP